MQVPSNPRVGKSRLNSENKTVLIISAAVGIIVTIVLFYYFIQSEQTVLDLDKPKIPSLVIITEKNEYEVGEKTLITIKNVGTVPLHFVNDAYGISIDGFFEKWLPVCCTSTANITTLGPNQQYALDWDQKNMTDGNQVKEGDYRITVSYTSSNPQGSYKAIKIIKISEKIDAMSLPDEIPFQIIFLSYKV